VSRILCLCDEGVNRSVTIAHQLKYLGHDVLSAGLRTNSVDTLMTLAKWADHVIYTEPAQRDAMLLEGPKVHVWDVGPDRYPRPFNRQLLRKVKVLVDRHQGELA
jgi:galactitol-specific phosphotransferase system IIB component